MAVDEPVIDLDDIQGNIYPGFNKDHQTLRFLVIADVAAARLALAAINRQVSTAAMVRDFGLLRAKVRAQRAGGPSGLSATWTNVSLSHGGLAKLASVAVADGIGSGAFKVGLAARSALLGDPLDPHADGHPTTWTIGAPGGPAVDMVVTIAGDRRDDVDAAASDLEAMLAAFAAPDGGPALRVAMPDLNGDTLGGKLNGHEHFGFKDGVSQPGIRGRPRDAPATFITPRLIDPSSPLAQRFGRPGQVLLWPGQLMLGQPRQTGRDPMTPIDPLPVPASWVTNGSFMVLRLLEQDVPGFWIEARAVATQVLGKADDVSVDWAAARLVGRWRSGTPLARSPDADTPAIADDARLANDFQFRSDASPVVLVPGQPPLPRARASHADPDGAVCPLGAHIRKVNPRDDSVEQGSPTDTLTRLLVRRGIPFGPPLKDPRHDAPDGVSRGLAFVSFQASIERQFEFLMQNWVNGDDAPREGGGRDAVLGRHMPQGDLRETALSVADPNGQARPVRIARDFIIPRGGGYFFTPSIAGLAALADAPLIA